MGEPLSTVPSIRAAATLVPSGRANQASAVLLSGTESTPRRGLTTKVTAPQISQVAKSIQSADV
jgi:hypothetical protein